MPKALEGVIDQKTFTKAAAYNIDKTWFKIFSSTFSVAQMILAVQYDFLPFLWEQSAILLKQYASIHDPSEVYCISD